MIGTNILVICVATVVTVLAVTVATKFMRSEIKTKASIPKKSVQELHPELLRELGIIRERRNFDPKKWSTKKCAELLRYFARYNIKTAVVSVSGGIDSASVFALLKKAQQMANKIPDHPFNVANGGMIIGIAQPIHSTPTIQNRAFELFETLFGVKLNRVSNRALELLKALFGVKLNNNCYEGEGIKFVCEDQSDDYDLRIKRFERNNGCALKPFAAGMTKSYMRTPTAYMYALHYGGVVIGTGNLDEDGHLFYYCKFGDGAVDVGLIWDLHKSEVFTLARYLGVPESILIAPPSADLAPGQTDETEIGATYDMVELVYNFIKKFSEEERNSFIERLGNEAREQFYREKELIDTIHNRGAHKADLNPKNMGIHKFEYKLSAEEYLMENFSNDL